MGYIHAFRFRETSLRGKLLLPLARAGTTRLSGAAARLATLLRRAGARSPHRATAGLLRHAGSAALLAATLRAWTSPLLSLRWRSAPLLRAASLRAWTAALLRLRRQAQALLCAASTVWRHCGSALLRPSFRFCGWLLATRLATRLGGHLTSLLRRHAGPAFRARPSLFQTTWRLALLRGARRSRLRLLRHAGSLWLLRRARCTRRWRSLRCARCTWLLTPRLGRCARPWWLLRRARCAGPLWPLRCARCTWLLTPRLGRCA